MDKNPVHYFASFLLLTGIVLAAGNSPTEPVFSNLDKFVLVAENTIHLSDDTQVSSGDIASNNKINISSKNIINGALFSPNIHIASSTTINSNITFNRLTKDETSEILGSTSTPIQEPVVELPEIEDFNTGTTTVVVENEETLNPGNFDIIEIKEDGKLTITPGEYNLNKLQLRDGSTLIYTGTSTINVKREFKVNNDVLIAPNSFELSPTALTLNFKPDVPGNPIQTAEAQERFPSGSPGTHPSQSRHGNQSTSSDDNANQNKQNKSRAVNSVINIGDKSLITMKIIAPKSKINLSEEVRFRGQIFARDVQVSTNSLVGNKISILKEGDPNKLVSEDDISFFVNEVIVIFDNSVTFSEVREVIDTFGGRIVGFFPPSNLYKVEVFTETKSELTNVINNLEGNSLIIRALRNLRMERLNQ